MRPHVHHALELFSCFKCTLTRLGIAELGKYAVYAPIDLVVMQLRVFTDVK